MRIARMWALGPLLLVACGDATGADGDGGPADPEGGAMDAASAPDGAPSDATSADAGPVDGASPDRSAGCGKAAGIALQTWAPFTTSLDGGVRDYFVRLPPGYDPMRAYPVVYQFHGCSSSATRETNHPSLESQVGPDAILVRGRAASDCWDTSPAGPDVALFDAMRASVEAAFCADRARRFATGYSSGAFMSNVLGCVRGAELRGVANIAGGKGGGTCTGNVAALLIHDMNDPTVAYSSGVAARDAYLTRNGCDAVTAPTPVPPAPCAAYSGCAAGHPVTWCATSGKGHDRQDALAAPAFWGFLKQL